MKITLMLLLLSMLSGCSQSHKPNKPKFFFSSHTTAQGELKFSFVQQGRSDKARAKQGRSRKQKMPQQGQAENKPQPSLDRFYQALEQKLAEEGLCPDNYQILELKTRGGISVSGQCIETAPD